MGSIDIRFYLSLLLRRLGYVVTIVCLSTAVAVAIALLMPRQYQSTARILVEAPQIPAELVRSTVATNSLQQLQIIQQQITTREHLTALADKLKIYDGAKIKPTSDAIISDMQTRINFSERPLGNGDGATVFSVAFTAGTPAMAAKAANELASLILMSNQRQRTDRASDTLQLFNDEVARLEAELKQGEAKLLQFKNDNKDSLPESLDFRRQRQSSEQGRLAALEREEADLRARRSLLVESYRTTGQYTNAPLSPEQQTLQDLSRALSDQLLIFSDSSPNIVALRSRIASLRGNASKSASRDGEKTVSTGYDLQLADITERLDAIARERAGLILSIADLTRSVNATPSTDTELNAIERTVANVQTQYNIAIAKRAEASLGNQMEVRSDGGRFSMLEAATPPETATKSLRRVIAGFGVIAGVALSVCFVVLMEVLNKTIRRPSELASLLQHQPLAVIPYIPAPSDASGKSFRRKAMSMFPSGVVAASLLLLPHWQMPAEGSFQRLWSALVKTT